MTVNKSFLAILIFFLPCLLFAQPGKPVMDFSKADTLAKSLKYQDDLTALTKALTNPFPEQILKVRAIFRWITWNIEYDVKFFNKYNYRGKEPKAFTCRGDSMDCEVKKQAWETEYLNKVLHKKVAVCQGYAMLFKRMCDIAGIESVVITGYVRTEYYEVGTAGDLDHAWNAVNLNGTWYLLDATWAAGGCVKNDDGKLLFFSRHFSDYYWLTPAEDFARNHFPEDEKWILLPHYTKDNFSANPWYATDVLKQIRLLAPASGMFSAKKGDVIHFKFRYAGYIQDLQINTNIFRNPDTWVYEQISRRKRKRVQDTAAIKQQQYIKFSRNGDLYEFDYPVKDYNLEYLEVVFDEHPAMRFKVNY
jgi:hypothetical protein